MEKILGHKCAVVPPEEPSAIKLAVVDVAAKKGTQRPVATVQWLAIRK